MCDFGLDGLSSGPLARPARRAGVGGDRADLRREGRAAGEGALALGSSPGRGANHFGTLTRSRVTAATDGQWREPVMPIILWLLGVPLRLVDHARAARRRLNARRNATACDYQIDTSMKARCKRACLSMRMLLKSSACACRRSQKPRAPRSSSQFETRRPRALDAARLCGAGARGLSSATRSCIARSSWSPRTSRPSTLSASTRARRERDAHPLLDLLARPNPRQEGAAFLESGLRASAARRQRLYRGGDRSSGAVRELYALRPDRMRVVPGADGWPEAYEYVSAGRTRALRAERSRCRRSCI